MFMILLFSEYKSDYTHYIFPYAIWAMPEQGEAPSDLFARGFLPSSKNLDRYYLCRQIRVRLDRFQLSSENRRVIRKGEGISYRLVARADFEFTDQWKIFCKSYADQKFGIDVMSDERLSLLFQAPIISHLLVFTDSQTGQDIGLITLYLESPTLAYYYYAFYDLGYFKRNLGMYMMTSTVAEMAARKIAFVYLGTCYHRNALYKTQFQGAEFFNGFRWSENMEELKFLLEHDVAPMEKHLLESEQYLKDFYADNVEAIKDRSIFKLRLE
jgi:arginyl-tRNA--protein-N-Asp/Glu arginylyltransferase